jgi:hypothetical protein
MSKKKHIPRRLTNPGIVQLEDQLYSKFATGQMVRIDPQGRQVPRIRMSKKEKIKLRKELRKIDKMDSQELANKILESVESVPVVNPKTDEQLKIEQKEMEQYA